MNTDPDMIGEDEIAYIMDVCDVKEQTKKTYVKAIGLYCKHYTGTDPSAKMGLLWNEPDRVRKFISMDEFAKLVRLANPTERMVLILGAFMGLRRKEIADIRLSDILNDSILIRGKGHQDGKVVKQVMTEAVTTEIYYYQQYRKKLRGQDNSDGRLIVHMRNGRIENYCDSLPALSNMIAKLGRKAGVDMTIHSLRRLYCTTLEDEGCPIEVIKTLMRHNSINTTINFYLNPNRMKKREWVEKQNGSLRQLLYKVTAIS